MAEEKGLGAAVVGLGVGRSHLRAYANTTGARAVAACDLDENLLAEVKREYGLEYAYTDYRRLLGNPEVQVVSICTPDDLHAEQALAALDAGKHVLVEKPMCTSIEEARRLIAKARVTGLKLAVGNVLRFWPQFVAVHKLIADGRLGDLFHVEADYIHDCREVYARTPWRSDPQHPQCIVLGGAVHPIDLMRWVAGEVGEVFAYSNHKALSQFPLPDNYVAVMKFKSGCTGKCQVSTGVQRRPHQKLGLLAYGTQGSIWTDINDPEVSLYVADEVPHQNRYATIPVEPQAGKPIQAEIEQLLSAIHGSPLSQEGQTPLQQAWHFCDRAPARGQPMVDVIDGAKTVAVCWAIVESAQTGQPIKVQTDF